MPRVLLVSLVVLLFCRGDALAQTWPSKPIRAIIPFAAGSATDVVPRVVFEPLSAQLGQVIVVENRGGAGTTIGAALVAKAEADGYTLLATSSAHTLVPTVYPSAPYDTAAGSRGQAARACGEQPKTRGAVAGRAERSRAVPQFRLRVLDRRFHAGEDATRHRRSIPSRGGQDDAIAERQGALGDAGDGSDAADASAVRRPRALGNRLDRPARQGGRTKLESVIRARSSFHSRRMPWRAGC